MIASNIHNSIVTFNRKYTRVNENEEKRRIEAVYNYSKGSRNLSLLQNNQ